MKDTAFVPAPESSVHIPIPEHSLLAIYEKYFDGTWPDLYTVHSYGPVYENILAPYRFTAKNILEIGLFTGARLRIWEEYFKGNVYGIDCDERPHAGMADLRPMILEGTHNIHIFDACNKTEIQKRFKKVKFDVVIEDASHDVRQQVDLYKAWKPYLAPGAIYIIEDIQHIDENILVFQRIDSEKTVEIIDRRSINNRYDDVIIVIK